MTSLNFTITYRNNRYAISVKKTMRRSEKKIVKTENQIKQLNFYIRLTCKTESDIITN